MNKHVFIPLQRNTYMETKLNLLDSLKKSTHPTHTTSPILNKGTPPGSIPYIPPPGTSRTDWFEWYGGTYLTSDHWQKVRKLVLERDKHRCRFCGCSGTKTNYLEIHHRDYDHLYREHDNQDCVSTLCKRCHRGMHRLKK